jgi:hypothetical protein
LGIRVKESQTAGHSRPAGGFAEHAIRVKGFQPHAAGRVRGQTPWGPCPFTGLPTSPELRWTGRWTRRTRRCKSDMTKLCPTWDKVLYANHAWEVNPADVGRRFKARNGDLVFAKKQTTSVRDRR